MSITWMPDDSTEMERFPDLSVEEFLARNPGWNIHGEFNGPGIYLVNDGVLSELDIRDGLTSTPGRTIGTIIVR